MTTRFCATPVHRAGNARRLALALLLGCAIGTAIAQPETVIKNPKTIDISETSSNGAFPLVSQGAAASLYHDSDDFEVVKIAAGDLSEDINRVSHVKPEVITDIDSGQRNIVIIGTLRKSEVIDDLAERGKIDLEEIEGQWETFKIVVVENPLPDVDSALVIAGSDRRGTAYGVYELSRQIGVSPWYYWADVPVLEKQNIWVGKGHYQYGPPSVTYRGMFINDWGYGLRRWQQRTLDPDVPGGHLYKLVYELMLRLRSNYVWGEGDMDRAELADDYAIVIGSAHNHNMLGRHWNSATQGPWQYDINRENIYDQWDKQIEERHHFENVYTLGMRGSGDLPMVGDLTVDEKVDLMEQILADQRDILSRHIDKPLGEIPQVLVLYKEVLDLYNLGIEVPDDVTLIWPDDNFSYMKRLSNPRERERSGGSGIYYHLSYLGRPQAWLWLSTVNPMLLWEEVQKSYDFNARRLWVFNVGDIKPAEYMYSLAMDMAWDITQFNKDNVQDHLTQWMAPIFGDEYKEAITEIMYDFYLLAFARKPEFMKWDRIEPNTPIVDTEFSMVHYREAERRLAESKSVKERAEAIYNELGEEQQPAFYQLVYYPASILYYVDGKMLMAQKNRLFAKQGRVTANHYADMSAWFSSQAVEATEEYYNMLDGKWDQVMPLSGRRHFYTPPTSIIENPSEPEMGVFPEGFEDAPMIDGEPALPWFNSIYPQSYYLEVYNKGTNPFDYELTPSHDWIQLSHTEGRCTTETRIMVNVDFDRLANAQQKHEGTITVTGAGSTETINVFAFTPQDVTRDDIRGMFVEDNGAIAIHAENFHRKHDGEGIQWETTKYLGVTGASIGTYPFTALPVEHEWKMEEDSPYVEYDFYSFNAGWVDIYTHSLPVFPINTNRHCLYGISIDNGPPLIVDFETNWRNEDWKQNVQRNQSVDHTKHFIERPGKHTLRVWMIDSGVFIDEINIDFGGLKQAYMGPQETIVE